ncbi:MAG: PilC/PilY family type IV pilus protein [Ideonella sp.]|nr:PilC/PilY family type IV pilus protein [Ideonella sp.]
MLKATSRPVQRIEAITTQTLSPSFHNADAVVGSKIYLRYSLLLRCFDFATDSQCGSIRTADASTHLNDPGQLYATAWDTTTTRVDPTRPNCVLIVGASGLAHMFDPTKTGGQLLENNPPKPCGGGGGTSLPELDVNPSQALQCDATRAKVLGWDQLRLSQSVPWGGAGGLSAVKVTLKTAAGTVLPAALKPVRYFDIGSYALDISDIAYSDYPALKVAVELQSPGNLAANGSAGVDVTWKSDGIQVCVSTQAPPDPDCQTVATLTVNSKLLGNVAGSITETLQVSKVMSPGGLSSGYSAVAAATSPRAVLADKGPRDPKTLVTQGRWSLQDFSGDLWAFGLEGDGSIRSSTHFSAQEATASPRERPLFVATPSGGDMPVKPLEWAGLTPAQQAALNTNLKGLTDTQGAERLAYLRGADGGFRPRGGKSLGPVINSSPAVLLPAATVGLNEQHYPGYSAYRATVTRPYPLAIFGGNDGALHGYEVLATGLREAWSFVPDVMLARAANYSDASLAGVRANPYFVDNIPMVGHVDTGTHGWRAVAVMTYGRGARAITALDVTSTDLAQGKGVLFEYNNTTDPALKDLGYVVSQPVSNNALVAQQIVQMGTPEGTGRRAAVLVGNGLNSNDGAGGVAHSGTGKAVLYAFYFDRSGAPRWHRWAVDELWAGAASEPGLTVNNGLSTPAPVDVDGDGRVDVVYAGDLQGNLWRFDVRNPAAASVTRLFQTDAQQPITQAPLVTMNTQASGCGSAEANVGAAAKRCWQVVFSTGAPISPLLGSANVATQSLYGVLDKGRGQGVSMGSLTRIGFVANEIVQGVEYRALDPTTVDYQGNALGWRIDLQSFEHGVGAPRMQPTGLVMFSSIRPVTPDKAINVCIGPRSWLNEVDPLNGYSALLPFDINQDGQINGQDRLAASSNKPLSPSGMAVSGAQFGPLRCCWLPPLRRNRCRCSCPAWAKTPAKPTLGRADPVMAIAAPHRAATAKP